MKKKDLNNLRKKTVKELLAEVEKLRRKRLELHTKIPVGKEKNVKAVRNLKKDIAQILTIVSEKRRKENKK